MANLLTRDIINNDIIFKDVNVYNLYQKDKTYNFNDLNKKINIIKNLLLHDYKCIEGQTILIGIAPSLLQIAAFFACAELGLTVIIADHSRNDNWIDPNYVDPKTQSLLPINYFLVESKKTIPKYRLFYKICEKVIIIKNIKNIDDSDNNYIGCNENSILFKCTSSGTTGTSKLITHTHKFLYKLIKRNKNFFYGNVCMAHNLNHGSSPATFFLPSLCSSNTKLFVSYMITYITEDKIRDNDVRKLAINKFKHYNFDHFMIPYTHLIDKFLVDSLYPNLNLYTLSTIKKDWLNYFRENKIKNIISIFGSNETSGPVFINEISDPKFEESKYKLVDNFYEINLLDKNLLEIVMPVYNTKIITNDLFDKVDDNYYHRGRKDLYRVNGAEVDIKNYNKIIKELLDADLIIDTIKDSLYVAVWSDSDVDDKLKDISYKIEKDSAGAHKVNKISLLNKSNFMTGIKLDMELLRDYFRKYV